VSYALSWLRQGPEDARYVIRNDNGSATLIVVWTILYSVDDSYSITQIAWETR
jgi:hypothetical protein